MKTPQPPSSPLWVAGPDLTASDDLLKWLDTDGKGKVIDLPVQVGLSPLGISRAQLAPPGQTADENALRLKLDDSKMGISLKDRLRERCSSMDVCWVWLRGTWGAALSGPGGPGPMGPGVGPGPAGPAGPEVHPFAVTEVVGPVNDEDAPVVRLQK